jgi:putative ABC transport system permease protein
MILAALREARTNLRLWFAIGPIIMLATALMLIVFSMRDLSVHTTEGESAMQRTDATLLAVVLAATLAILAISINQAVGASRRRYAMFELVGMAPSGARSMLTQQVVICTVVATGLGLALGVATARPVVHLLSRVGTETRPVSGHIDAHALVGATVIALGVSLIAGARAMAVTRTIQPVEALKPRPWVPPPPAPWRTTWVVVAWTVAVAASVLAAAMPYRPTFRALPVEAANLAASFGGLHTLALAAALALTAPTYCPKLIRAWTALIPERLVPTAFLGRRGAAYQAGRSLEAFNLVLVGALLAGAAASLYYGRSALDPAGRGWVEARDMTAVVLAGVPVALALVGSAATVAISTRNRFDEVQTLRLLGATPRQVLLAGFFETMILAVTALAVAAAGVAWVALSAGTGFAAVRNGPDWPESIGWGAPVWLGPAAVSTFVIALVTACSLPSVIRGLRRTIA